eukprot:CAMPEP_0202699650 /NCGR_PEP_ID=MMETSP1385-20130828/12866_1 /ASSEMBLY_ACC=CAM_ASM_000861 /TAXON_ID=933848 /ORGANISM="Elphidium margaritaceum" /LENGTH=221 /DNA_ID=CAMNT_0049356639 /DNA_START=46 /DNA_END=711 /DNA_ORIENTATION=+
MAQTTSADVIQRPFIQRLIYSLQRRSQLLLDKSTPHTAFRWIGFTVLAFLYLLRVWFLQGFYIVTYGLGIYLLNLFIGFLQPQDDMDASDGPLLPSYSKDDDTEFRPFARRVPEFKFWWAATKAVMISMLMTLFSIFDIPVFWPILLLYFIVLFTITMKRQIEHMIKHSYIPCDCFRKKRYKGGKDSHKIVKKKKVVPVMPKVRPPIRGLPTGAMKKVNRD